MPVIMPDDLVRLEVPALDLLVLASREEVRMAVGHGEGADRRNVACERELELAGREVPDLRVRKVKAMPETVSSAGLGASSRYSREKLEEKFLLWLMSHAPPATLHSLPFASLVPSLTLITRSPAPVANHWFPGSTATARTQPIWPEMTRDSFHWGW
jgi:hypothetical protein